MNKFSADVSQANTGSVKQIKNNMTAWRQIIVCPTDFEIATEALALTLATWTAAIKAPVASRIYPFPQAVSFENQSKESVYEDFPLAGSSFVKEGLIGFTMNLNINKAQSNKLRKFNGRSCKIFIIDDNGNIICTSSDGTKVQPFSVQEIRVETAKLSDGSASVTTPVKVVLSDTTEFNDRGYIIQPLKATSAWNPKLPSNLDGVYDVTLSVSDITTAGFVASVNIDSIVTTDESSAIVGLAKEDFTLVDKDGDAVSITTSTDNGDGTYDIAVTITEADSDYSFDLVACSLITLTDIAIESTGAVTVTVVES